MKGDWGNILMLNRTEDTRRHIRYSLEEGGITLLDLLDDNQSIICSLYALITNSSVGGSELLLMSKFPPSPNQKVQVKFSELGTFQGQVIWTRQLEEEVFKLGIQYLN